MLELLTLDELEVLRNALWTERSEYGLDDLGIALLAKIEREIRNRRHVP